ncbi:amphi-Trp domain-containing protein [Streptomyces cahuitamycinicus]|uniref:Amphi-Trp domain-containing protein n=1 Tax=Streptomyces cahuitamycinicus TaxID=2070367 RepID=A0A2N8TNP9_9ACTN|nr:amphi-Trp domain-containing protein [Streptomyces cahuitamycinicus]PNG20647.1 amphi-Trp domain-containing protein [Streptomyces cahuitamycinicus]
MKDLTFEQKRSLSRHEAADQLTALADALREGGDAELDLGPGTLGLRIPDDLHSELEVEIGGGEIELEIELKWKTAPTRATPQRSDSRAEKPKRANTPASGRSGTGAGRAKSTKRSAAKSP